MLILLCFFGCNRNKSNLITSEYIDVDDSSELVIKESTNRNIPIGLIESMSIFDAALLFEPITEIEMIFVEGGSMIIQGQEIRLDSFYISKYVLSDHVYVEAHNWAHNRGYLGNIYPINHGGGGSLNILLRWAQAIAVCNWLSIQEGLMPVYWRENKTEYIQSSEQTIALPGLPHGEFVNYSSFYIDWNADGYRLPTEAEWEFAARGGNKSRRYRYSGSDTLTEVLTNFRDPFNMHYIPGQMKSNELGIHDMSNRASEWVIGPWVNFGEMGPEYNPNRIEIFNFKEPFYLIQKGGNSYVEFLGVNNSENFIVGNSFRPEERIKIQPNFNQLDYNRQLEMASLRLVRRSGL